MIEKKVTLRLGECAFPERIRVSQFDTMWRFVFTILYKNQPWIIPRSGGSLNTTAILNGRKPDGNVFAFAGTINGDNTVTVDCDVQMTAVAGQTVCELSILSEGKVVGTANFVLDVEAAPKSPDDVSSDSTLPAYGEILDKIAEMEGGGGGSVTPESIVTATGQMTTEQANRARANINAAAAETVVTVSGTTPTITPAANTIYNCGELTSLTISNPPATVAYSIVFTSGATATTTTIQATILGLESFAAEANTIYEINVLDNRAVVGSWAVSA